MIGFENVVSASFRNKKDAKKDLVFKLLKSIWADMERKLDVIRARGVEYEEIKVVEKLPATFVTRNKVFLTNYIQTCLKSIIEANRTRSAINIMYIVKNATSSATDARNKWTSQSTTTTAATVKWHVEWELARGSTTKATVDN